MYAPRFAPKEYDARWVDDEHRTIARELASQIPFLFLQKLYAAPEKILDGMIVYADGTTWNPSGGEGIYARIAGAWVKL